MNAFKCPNCAKSTMGWENYCVDCGYPLNVECPECGEIWRYMFVYEHCPNCGHDMSQVPIVYEERPKSAIENKTIKKEKSK